MGLVTILIASCLGCIPGAIAQRKGYPFGPWWAFGTLLFVVALPASLAVHPRNVTTDATDAKVERELRRPYGWTDPQWNEHLERLRGQSH
jgi:hypothetical protein